MGCSSLAKAFNLLVKLSTDSLSVVEGSEGKGMEDGAVAFVYRRIAVVVVLSNGAPESKKGLAAM